MVGIIKIHPVHYFPMVVKFEGMVERYMGWDYKLCRSIYNSFETFSYYRIIKEQEKTAFDYTGQEIEFEFDGDNAKLNIK